MTPPSAIRKTHLNLDQMVGHFSLSTWYRTPQMLLPSNWHYFLWLCNFQTGKHKYSDFLLVFKKREWRQLSYDSTSRAGSFLTSKIAAINVSKLTKFLDKWISARIREPQNQSNHANWFHLGANYASWKTDWTVFGSSDRLTEYRTNVPEDSYTTANNNLFWRTELA